jgi:hypothetical protein
MKELNKWLVKVNQYLLNKYMNAYRWYLVKNSSYWNYSGCKGLLRVFQYSRTHKWEDTFEELCSLVNDIFIQCCFSYWLLLQYFEYALNHGLADFIFKKKIKDHIKWLISIIIFLKSNPLEEKSNGVSLTHKIYTYFT